MVDLIKTAGIINIIIPTLTFLITIIAIFSDFYRKSNNNGIIITKVGYLAFALSILLLFSSFFKSYKCAGFGGFSVKPDGTGILKHIVVSRESRKQGIGAEMIRWIVAEYGLSELYAETDGDALGFYKKVGFIAADISENKGIIRYGCRLFNKKVKG